MNTALHFSSATDQHATPRAFAAKLVEGYGITLDVCADASNAVVPDFFSKEQDGLTQEWTGVCWMNPPYGRDIGKWTRKAAESASKGATVICLLPSRTDTKWFQDAFNSASEVTFLSGRLKFGDVKNSAPFPSVVIVFRPETSDFDPYVRCQAP